MEAKHIALSIVLKVGIGTVLARFPDDAAGAAGGG